MKLQTDLREFVALLSSRGVEFLVVGGHALAFHGHPRFTGDIDLLVRPSKNNATRLVQCLAEFGFGSLPLQAEDFCDPGYVVQLGRPPNRIDLLTSISGVEFDRAWEARVAGQLDGLDVFFIGYEHFVINKRASGRMKDLADLEALGEPLGKE